MMGAGLAQIVAILVAAVFGLPLFFFGLMSALDRFEQSISGGLTGISGIMAAPPRPVAETATTPEAVPPTHLEPALPGLDVIDTLGAVVRLQPNAAVTSAGGPRQAAAM
jgi:hypothetical protein